MKKRILSVLVLIPLLLMTSCATKITPLDAKYISVEPSPLELRGGVVPVTVTINFPAKWMPKNAVIRVTPVLKYATGEAWGSDYYFQGENVRGNVNHLPYDQGLKATLHANFKYSPEMASSELYLMIEADIKGKKTILPDIKIAEGIIATEDLASAMYSTPAIAPDAFQQIIKESYDASIHFLIQQANVRSAELRKADVKEWMNIIESADITPNQNVDIEVQAYASPDGGVELNEKLAAQREKSTTAQIERDLKRKNVDVPMSAHYTAQDWEGFQELLEKSDIQDKEIVLRVLSMYDDPEVREREIKNISYVFSQLADEILPQLRRSRLIANIEIIGKSDEEIAQLAKEKPGSLNIEELLYAATLTNDIEEQKEIYNMVSYLFANDPRAFNNLGAIAYSEGDYGAARQYFRTAQSLDQANGTVTPALQVNLGLISLLDGDTNEALTLVGQVSNVAELDGVLGLIHLERGEYSEAARLLYDTTNNNGILAQLLNRDYNRAQELFDMTEKRDETTYYLQALIGARTAQPAIIKSGITEAVRLNPSLATVFLNDLEFARYMNEPFFQQAIRR